MGFVRFGTVPVALAVATLLTACGPAARTAGVNGIRTTPDGLLVAYTGGGCDGRVHAELHERARSVEVRVVAGQTSENCDDIGILRTLPVDLRKPLGTRSVTNARDGRQMRAFSHDDLLEPSWLPEGFALARESEVTAAPPDSPTVSWQRTWSGMDACSSTVTVLQTVGTSTPPRRSPGWGRPTVLEVHGHDAQLWRYRSSPPRMTGELLVSWVTGPEDPQVVEVRADERCSRSAPLGLDSVLQFARGLR